MVESAWGIARLNWPKRFGDSRNLSGQNPPCRQVLKDGLVFGKQIFD